MFGEIWYFNDKNVCEIEKDKIFNDEPYLLFYEQIDINEQKKKEIKIIQINEEIYENTPVTPDTPDGNYSNDNYSRTHNIKKGNKVKNSSLNSSITSKEGINNNPKKKNEQKTEENKQLLNAKRKNKNSDALKDKESSNQQEESLKNNIKIFKRAQSSNKTDAKFGKINEHVKIDCKKSKENIEKYKNPLEEIKKINDNEIEPKGLYNLGLNCYMNSLLQCLFYIKELRNHFINNKYKFTDDQPVCKAFAEVMNGLKNCDKKSFEPKQFKKLMEK